MTVSLSQSSVGRLIPSCACADFCRMALPLCYLYAPIAALEGGRIPRAVNLFQCISVVLRVAFFVCQVPTFCMSSPRFYCLSAGQEFVCLVVGI